MKAFLCALEKLFLKHAIGFSTLELVIFPSSGTLPDYYGANWLFSVHFNKLPLVLTEITEHMGLGPGFNFGQHCKVNNCQSEGDQCSELTGCRFIILTKTCPKREQQLI